MAGNIVKDILEKSGIDPRAVTVVVYAQEWSPHESLPLDFVLKNNIMMAYLMNGQL